MPDENKNEAGAPEKIALTVEGKSVEKTLDELKTLATSALTTGDKTYSIKVNGEERNMTLEELMAKASEAAGAQKKFEEASNLRTKAQKGMQILELLEQTKGQKTPDTAKATELMKLLGVADTEIADILSGLNSEGNNMEEGKNPKGKGEGGTPKKVTLDDMDPRVRTIVEAAEQNDLRQIRENIEKEAKKTLDNDKVLGKMIDELPDDASKDKIREVLYGMIIDDVRSEILGRKPYGTEMLQSSLQKVRTRVQNLGIPTRSAGQAPVMGELGISAAISPEIRAAEPIQRVKSSEAGYDDNVVKRVQQLMFKAMKRGGRQ
jgi:hypothetical protein